MKVWRRVKDIEKVLDLFGESISFHDAEVAGVKYKSKTAYIKINCRGFIKTMSRFDDRFKLYQNVYITFVFKNVNLFEIDMDCGVNFINEFILEDNGKGFTAILEGYCLKIVCEEIEVGNIDIIYKQNDKQNKMLDDLLKSNV